MAGDSTPRASGFRMPAEWEPHEATWLAWPHNRDDWPGKIAAIYWVYAEIVRHLHRHELVRLIVSDAAKEKQARRVLGQAGVDFSRIEFHCFPTDRSWVRDTGPLFVTNGVESAATSWRFSAWAKYPNWRRDDRVAGKIASRLGAKTWEPKHNGRRVVLEGGAVDVNGLGSMLTTEECLLSSDTQQRNPGMTRDDYETVFRDYLGVENVLWLGNGIVGDDTHGHVDDLARFVGPRTIVTVVEADSADSNYEALQDNLRRLRRTQDQDGRRFKIVELPMPRPLTFAGLRLPASYANFYISNGLVLVPTFNDPNDRVALDILAKLFPDREVIGIHSVDFAWGFGTLHCSTQQQPVGART